MAHKFGKDKCIGEVIIPYWAIVHATPYDKWYILYPVSQLIMNVRMELYE